GVVVGYLSIAPSTTVIYPLSLHDALPISGPARTRHSSPGDSCARHARRCRFRLWSARPGRRHPPWRGLSPERPGDDARSGCPARPGCRRWTRTARPPRSNPRPFHRWGSPARRAPPRKRPGWRQGHARSVADGRSAVRDAVAAFPWFILLVRVSQLSAPPPETNKGPEGPLRQMSAVTSPT